MTTWADVLKVGGAPIAIVLVGMLLFRLTIGGKVARRIKRSRHPIEGAGHFISGCALALLWAVGVGLAALWLFAVLRGQL